MSDALRRRRRLIAIARDHCSPPTTPLDALPQPLVPYEQETSQVLIDFLDSSFDFEKNSSLTSLLWTAADDGGGQWWRTMAADDSDGGGKQQRWAIYDRGGRQWKRTMTAAAVDMK